LWWRWSLNSMWPFSLPSFKSSPMLSVLLSVEELELLVIPYCHVFENHLHFLSLWLICPSTSSYYHQAMVPILRHIVITDFNVVLVAASFSTVFLLLPKQNMYWSTLQVEFYEIFFPTSYRTHETDSEQESCAYFTPAMQLSEADFRLRSAQCFCHISLYGSSKLMILDALERRFEGSSEY
jgi:hypothetical protein